MLLGIGGNPNTADTMFFKQAGFDKLEARREDTCRPIGIAPDNEQPVDLRFVDKTMQKTVELLGRCYVARGEVGNWR